MVSFSALLLPALLALGAKASTPDPSGTFVHLFEWSWADVATECETFLGPKGYDAVQVRKALWGGA